jgi:aconitate hydratase
MDYLEDAGLVPYFDALGFHLAAFGCTTCIGNSGPLHPAIEKTIKENDLNVASVLSGNRNFEARIHQNIKSNFLASPMLVVIRPGRPGGHRPDCVEPVGIDPNGNRSTWRTVAVTDQDRRPGQKAHVKKEFYKTQYAASSTATNSGTPWILPKAPPLPGTMRPPTSKTRPTSTGFQPGDRSPGYRPMRPPFCCWATRSPPTTSPRPGPSPRTIRPARYLIENGVDQG